MEFQFVSDMAVIMDSLPFSAMDQDNIVEQNQQIESGNKKGLEHTTKQEHNWPSHISPESSVNEISDDTSDADLYPYPWTNDIKLALKNVKNSLSATTAGITSIARKRKHWESVESSREMSFVDEHDAVSNGLKCSDNKIITTLSRLKEGPDEPGDSSKLDEGSTRMGNWQVEDIADNLAADLDGSLSGLGVDLTTASYNMSEALLALPSLTVFKQEVPSPSGNNDGRVHPDSNGANNKSMNSMQLQLLQQQQQLTPQQKNGGTFTPSQGTDQPGITATSSNTPTRQTEGFQLRNVLSGPLGLPSIQQESSIDCRFQYVLAAATSIATKVNEETLTYLNQGQSYEIKLKKLGELSAYRGKILKSVIRVSFHERRLQYTEREQLASWQLSRPGERVLEVDVPLSYGLLDVTQDQALSNVVEFDWDPTREVGVYIKVNCISTEFTPKKHGGEKGVPFRVQVETFLQGECGIRRLHAAACQVKVFKLKGADRKHKQDREKILKRPVNEQEKFQPSYECTVLNDITTDMLFPTTAPSTISPTTMPHFTSSETCGNQARGVVVPNASTTSVTVKDEGHQAASAPVVPSPVHSSSTPEQPSFQPDDELPLEQQSLSPGASVQQTCTWLTAHRFSAHLHTFASFCGADLLCLSRDDLVQICGLAEGVRLYNALHGRAVAPRLTLYMSVGGTVFHALYLGAPSSHEVALRVSRLLALGTRTPQLLLQGPGGIHVLLTDEVVANLSDHARFIVQPLSDSSGEIYQVLLKPASR